MNPFVIPLYILVSQTTLSKTPVFHLSIPGEKICKQQYFKHFH